MMSYQFYGDVSVPRERVTTGVPTIPTNHALIHAKRGFELSGTFAANGTSKALIALNPTAKAKATAAITMTDTDANLLYTFNEYGLAGNDWKVVHVVAGNNTPLTVTVSATTITVNIATNAGGSATSTAALVAAAVNASVAGEYVTCTVPGTGGVVNAVASANFTNGAEDVYIHFQTGDFTAAAAAVVLRIIEAGTYTGTAATFTPINKSRIRPLGVSAARAAGTLAATVTVGAGATVLETATARGSASGPGIVSVTKRNDDEWVLEPGKAYLFEFTPAAATAIDYRLFWYEEENG